MMGCWWLDQLLKPGKLFQRLCSLERLRSSTVRWPSSKHGVHEISSCLLSLQKRKNALCRWLLSPPRFNFRNKRRLRKTVIRVKLSFPLTESFQKTSSNAFPRKNVSGESILSVPEDVRIAVAESMSSCALLNHSVATC